MMACLHSERTCFPDGIIKEQYGGVLLALIEGVGILFTRYSAEQFKPINPQMEDPSQLNPGGIFGAAAAPQ